MTFQCKRYWIILKRPFSFKFVERASTRYYNHPTLMHGGSVINHTKLIDFICNSNKSILFDHKFVKLKFFWIFSCNQISKRVVCKGTHEPAEIVSRHFFIFAELFLIMKFQLIVKLYHNERILAYKVEQTISHFWILKLA